jgi:hypothetical protein
MPDQYPQAVLRYDFFDLAKQYREAYKALREVTPPEVTPISWPRYFLFCHSIELVLKAYLAHTGLTEKQLQNPPIRHNIKNLLDKAIKCGLSLSAGARDKIEDLTETYTNHWPRYPMTKSAFIPLIHQFEPDATELFKAVDAALHPGRPFFDGQG